MNGNNKTTTFCTYAACLTAVLVALIAADCTKATDDGPAESCRAAGGEWNDNPWPAEDECVFTKPTPTKDGEGP